MQNVYQICCGRCGDASCLHCNRLKLNSILLAIESKNKAAHKYGIVRRHSSPTCKLLHSLYNIILNKVSECLHTYKLHTNPLQITKTTQVSTQNKTRYKTPWIIFLHLQMVFLVEISLELLS